MYEKRRAIHRKMIVHPELKAAVEDRLKAGWSPEQIAGRMRLERHPIRVSHETIYRFTCSKDGRAEQFYRHLPEHRRRRRPRGYQGAGGGRIVLPDEQIAARDEIRRTVAREALGRFAVGEEELIECCKFLAERWHAWSREGRPIAAAAYKIFLAEGVRLLQVHHGMSFDDINAIVGFQGGGGQRTLEIIWPDWAKEQTERLVATLKAQDLTKEHLEAFAAFLQTAFQDAIFHRLQSFERHAFEYGHARLAGMHSDLQGMSVAVEQAVRAMGGQGTQGAMGEFG